MRKEVKFIRCERGHVLIAEKDPRWKHGHFEIARSDLPEVKYCPYCGSSFVKHKGQVECRRCNRRIFSIANPSWRTLSHCKNWRYCPICGGLVEINTDRIRIKQ